jgi:DNA primase
LAKWAAGLMYTSNQIELVLRNIGIEIQSETEVVLLTLCPYHRNTDTPAFAVNKTSGAYICFAPHCDKKGNILKLVQDKMKCNPFVAKRLIEKYRGEECSPRQYLDNIFKNKEDCLPLFSQEIINRLYDDLWNSPGQAYMNSRGLEDKTLAYFSIGYSKLKNMVTIPMHDTEGQPVGMVARSINGKRFHNSKNLPTRKIPFNVHRAKKYPGPVIIVESSMDAMMVHQAGFPCVMATNGSIFSQYHIDIINRYWNEVIIMTDFDDYNDHRDPKCNKCIGTCSGHNPGRALGEKMMKAMSGKVIKWAAFDYGIVYPHNAKDAGEMTMQEITQCIKNAVSDITYLMWKQEIELLNIV